MRNRITIGRNFLGIEGITCNCESRTARGRIKHERHGVIIAKFIAVRSLELRVPLCDKSDSDKRMIGVILNSNCLPDISERTTIPDINVVVDAAIVITIPTINIAITTSNIVKTVLFL